jgi:hypothetical protein
MVEKRARGYFEFRPELIVEVTMVCDRACSGCYAPNLVSNDDPEVSLRRHPELFLKPQALRERLSEITTSIARQLTSVSFRGGEPTRHPRLPELIDVALRFTRQLFVESHGRWALPPQDASAGHGALMKALARRRVVLKISFDTMHDMSAQELRDLVRHLDWSSVNWLVAITEPDRARFEGQRASCDWIPDSKIVFQTKAARPSDLYVPPLGVIRPDGGHFSSLSTKMSL